MGPLRCRTGFFLLHPTRHLSGVAGTALVCGRAPPPATEDKLALPRDVFKQKMEEGRRLAKERRASTLEEQKQAAMERAIERREQEILAQEEAYGGYSELSKSEVPEVSDRIRPTNGEARHVRVSDLPRDTGVSDSEASQANGPRSHAGTASECQLCKGFPWPTVPINVARDRFRWLTLEFQRVANIITNRENEHTRKRGCSICGGHPAIPDHWYSVKTTVDKSTGVEYTLYACSQPCYIDWPRKYPQFFGVNYNPDFNPHA